MQNIIDNKSITNVQPVWEYLIEDDKIDIDTLNQLGYAGWELTSVHVDNQFYFKRQFISVKDKD